MIYIIFIFQTITQHVCKGCRKNCKILKKRNILNEVNNKIKKKKLLTDSENELLK